MLKDKYSGFRNDRFRSVDLEQMVFKLISPSKVLDQSLQLASLVDSLKPSFSRI